MAWDARPVLSGSYLLGGEFDERPLVPLQGKNKKGRLVEIPAVPLPLREGNLPHPSLAALQLGGTRGGRGGPAKARCRWIFVGMLAA